MTTAGINKIQFHYLVEPFYFTQRTGIKRFLLTRFKKDRRAVEHINYIFCDDEYLLAVNQQYLNHHFYTDIITFELSGKNEPLLSDIYISINRVRENALTHQVSFREELLRVMFHGALHLLGFNDKKPKDQQLMRLQENKMLASFNSSTWNKQV